MQYWKYLLVLPLAAALSIETFTDLVIVATSYVTVTGGTPEASQTPASTTSSSPAVSNSTSSGSDGAGDCQPDTSGAYLSTGVDGNPDKSMIDSINRIRQMYNTSATCLKWSDSLGTAAQACADASSESHQRGDSVVVSDTGFPSTYYTADLATTEFERSMFVLLCQSPNDTQLQGTCPGNQKVGEYNCTVSPTTNCTGHHDVIVDATGQYNYFGVGFNSTTAWLSADFSATNVFS